MTLLIFKGIGELIPINTFMSTELKRHSIRVSGSCFTVLPVAIYFGGISRMLNAKTYREEFVIDEKGVEVRVPPPKSPVSHNCFQRAKLMQQYITCSHYYKG